ncbi:winged helix-turn-helix domain-containing protein [Variovorax sp. YR752]|uniref:protein kinase domain-containing protein n=1 Tax=Variovorax sp. YR752 TaxID=1884383 RepID=UPI00313817A8
MSNDDRPSGSGSSRGDDEGASFCYRFAGAEFDELALTLRVAELEVAVEPMPLRVLAELLRRPGEAVTRNELLDRLWPEPTGDHVLTSAVNRLRKALGAEAAERIESVPRVGYRFAGPVERIAVGRRMAQPLGLQSGQPVPGRSGMQLVRCLGGHSAGPVWLARGERPDEQRVYKFAADGESLATLKREYTVGRMLHRALGARADFVPPLGANFEHAPFWLEAAYAGTDLPTWAAQEGRLARSTRAERIALFVQIANAVAAAHGVAVLHRDLKPANVLVCDGPAGAQIRLVDFGASRLLQPERLRSLGVTALGLTVSNGPDAAGTPLYLAPELLAGHAPTLASDVYALGLMLYQLLVGDFRRPMSTGWQRDIDDALLVEDLTAATEGRPEARLQSAAELAHRLAALEARRAERERAASDAADAARAADLLQRSRARRPWVIAIVASLALGLMTSLWLQVRATDARQRAQAESARAEAVTEFLNKDVLQSADVLRASTQKTVSMFDILQRASERAGARFAGQPRTEAAVRRQLGDILLRLQYLAQAEREFARALELLEGTAPADDDEALAVRFGLAQTSVGLFRSAQALERLQAAEHAAGSVRLAGRTELARRAARARVDVLMDAQRPQEALTAAQRLVALSDALAGPDDIGMRFEARQRLGEVQLRLGDKASAEAVFAELKQAPFSDAGVGEALLARARLRAGREAINAGKLDEAEAILTGVRDAMTRAFGPNEMYAGGANFELTDIHIARGDLDKAAQTARAAAEAFATALGEQHFYTLNARANLAAVELDRGEAAEAMRQFDALRHLTAADRNAEALVAGIDFGRAKAMIQLGRAAQALALLDTVGAEQLAAASWGPQDFQWQIQAARARALLALGRRSEAIPLLREAISGMERASSYRWAIDRQRGLLARAERGTGR